PAFGQASSQTSSLSGVVVDKDGGVMPGVTVVVKNLGTGVALPTVVTNAAGVFSVAALDPGTYSVTMSLGGFKTVVMNDVRVLAATPASVNAKMEIGGVSETVEVQAHADVVQTSSSAIATTIQRDQINRLPTSN